MFSAELRTVWEGLLVIALQLIRLMWTTVLAFPGTVIQATIPRLDILVERMIPGGIIDFK